MKFDPKGPAMGGFTPGRLMLTLVGEGDPKQLCKRTVYGTIDGLVLYRLELTTLGQPSVASFLREVANQLAAQEGSIVAPVN